MKHPVSPGFMVAVAVIVPLKVGMAQLPPQGPEQICTAIERALVRDEPIGGPLLGNSRWQFTRENGFVVTRPNVGPVARNPFAFASHEQCVAQVATLLEQRACTVTIAPAKAFDVTRSSP